MTRAAQSLSNFLLGLKDDLGRKSPVAWADCVMIAEINGTELTVFNVSGEVEPGARVLGIDDGAVIYGTHAMDRFTGDDGGRGKYRLNIAQRVPRSLLGSVL